METHHGSQVIPHKHEMPAMLIVHTPKKLQGVVTVGPLVWNYSKLVRI